MCRRSWDRVLWHDPQLPSDLLEALWQNPDRVLASGRMLKDGERCTVVMLEWAERESSAASGQGGAAKQSKEKRGASRAMVLKRYNLKDTLHTAAHMPLRTRARRCWDNARRLIEAGLLTPRPLACVENRRHGALRLGSYLLTAFQPGKPLDDVIESGKLSPEEMRDFATQFVAIWRTLGGLRIGHGDMKAANFIVDSSKRIWLIDLDGMRAYRWQFLLRRERRNDLVRFMANWRDHPEVAAIFRARIGTG